MLKRREFINQESEGISQDDLRHVIQKTEYANDLINKALGYYTKNEHLYKQESNSGKVINTFQKMDKLVAM